MLNVSFSYKLCDSFFPSRTVNEWLYDLPPNYHLFLLISSEWFAQQLSHGWWNSYTSFANPVHCIIYHSKQDATDLQLLIRHFYARSNCHMPQLRETDNGRDSVFSLHCHNLLRSFLFLSRMKNISRVPFRAPSSEIKWLLCDATWDSIAANKAGKVFTRTVIIWNFRNHLNRYGSRLAISSHHRIILRIPSSSSTVVGQCDKQ